MPSQPEDRGFRIRALGEIAIRCEDVARQAAFYEEVLGLERMGDRAADQIVFFRIGPGFAGHTQILALFDKGYVARPGLHQTTDTHVERGAHSSLHHIALSLPFEEQEAAMALYDARGLAYRVEHFEWVGWRGVFTEDPEGNTVELVAYHDSLFTPTA